MQQRLLMAGTPITASQSQDEEHGPTMQQWEDALWAALH